MLIYLYNNYLFFFFCNTVLLTVDFPGGSVVENLPANTGNVALVPGSARPHGDGNGNPF